MKEAVSVIDLKQKISQTVSNLSSYQINLCFKTAHFFLNAHLILPAFEIFTAAGQVVMYCSLKYL